MAIVTYNKQNYEVIIKLQSTETNKNLKKGTDAFGKDVYEYELIHDKILIMHIMNDITLEMPKLILEYQDDGDYVLPNFYANGKCYAFVTITDLLYNNTIKHTFIIDNIQITTRTTNNTCYRIHARSYLNSIMEANIEYSTFNNTAQNSKESTQIIKDMLLYSKFPLMIDELSNIDSSFKIPYCCPTNTAIRRIIHHLLRLSMTSENGIFMLNFLLLKNKGRLLSLNKLYTKENIENIPIQNKFKIPSMFSISNEFAAIQKPDYNSFISADEQYYIGADLINNNFDYVKRSWSQDKYDYNRLNKILPAVSDISYEHSIRKYDNKFGHYTTETDNLCRSELYIKTNSLLNFLEDIQFSIPGLLDREPGQLCILHSDDVLLQKRYGGVWIIYRTYSTFDGETYNSNMTFSRFNRIKVTT